MHISGHHHHGGGSHIAPPPPAPSAAPAPQETSTGTASNRSESNPARSNQTRSNPAAPDRSTTQAVPAGRYAASASETTTTRLSLTTAEGDKVVLSLSNSSTDSAVTDGGDYSSLRTRQSSVNIQVDGNLNSGELKDIQELAKILAGAANSVLTGDNGEATQQVAKTDKLTSIQSFAFSLNRQVTQSFSYQGGGGAADQPVEPAP